MTYGISICGSTYPSYHQKLQKLQNKALKAICNAPYRSPAKPFYAQLNISQIEDVYKYEIAKFIFNFNKILAPSPFSNFFQKTNQVSNRSTKLSAEQDNLYIPRYRNNRLQRCIKYQAVRILNLIPKEIKQSTYNTVYSKITTRNIFFHFTKQNGKSDNSLNKKHMMIQRAKEYNYAFLFFFSFF